MQHVSVGKKGNQDLKLKKEKAIATSFDQLSPTRRETVGSMCAAKEYDELPPEMKQIVVVIKRISDAVVESSHLIVGEDLMKPYIPTRIDAIDKVIGGFRLGELIVIGARPGTGKTSFGLNMAKNFSEQEHRVYFCSLEMSNQNLSERLANISGCSFVASAKSEELKNIYFTDCCNKLDTILAATQFIRPTLLIIDYVQALASFRVSSNISQHEAVTKVTRWLQRLAYHHNMIVLALAQTNRNSVADKKQMPSLSDLKDSGSLEQDADIVAVLARDVMPVGQEPVETSFHILKNRNGGTGVAKLLFTPTSTLFTSNPPSKEEKPEEESEEKPEEESNLL